MKKIKELKNVILEYPDERELKEDELEQLKMQKEKLMQTRIVVSKEEILKRLDELDRGYTR